MTPTKADIVAADQNYGRIVTASDPLTQLAQAIATAREEGVRLGLEAAIEAMIEAIDLGGKMRVICIDEILALDPAEIIKEADDA